MGRHLEGRPDRKSSRRAPLSRGRHSASMEARQGMECVRPMLQLAGTGTE